MTGTAAARVGVLTFHRCINYGSYWQARRLVEGLRARGLDAALLDHRSWRVDRREWENALSPTRPTPTLPQDRPLFRRKVRLFEQAFAETLPLSERFNMDAPDEAGDWDAVVVGSDEVWNFRHPWFSGQPLFFGEGLKTGRRIAYAASFGNHDAADGLSPHWAERLLRFDALSVRDENSRRLIEQGLGVQPSVVIDPCLQFPTPALRPQAGTSNEVLVYGHHFPPHVVEAVRAWAGRRSLKLVSFGYRNDWADRQRIDEGPQAFAEAMGATRAVVTNFFHGCVFAVLNGKPFLAALSDYRTNKVRDLTDRLGLADRRITADSDAGAIEAALSEPLPPTLADRLATLRRGSSAYLDQALAGL